MKCALIFKLIFLVALLYSGAAPCQPELENVVRLSDLHTQVPVAAHLSFIEDPSNTWTIVQVAAADKLQSFKPAAVGTGDANFSYSQSTFWLRFTVLSGRTTPERWLLEVGFPSLDEVELFWRAESGAFVSTKLGDLQPFSARVFAHRHFVYPLSIHVNSTQTFYLKVRSQGSLTVPVTLWQPDALHAHDQTTYALLSLYYGVFIGLVMFNFLLFLAIGDRVFLFYVCLGIWMALSQATLDGLSNQYLWPEFPRWGNVALPSGMCLIGVFGTLFVRRFLNTRQLLPRLDRYLLLLVPIFLFAALGPLLIGYQIAAVLTVLLGFFAASTFFSIGLYAWHREQPGAKLFLLAWSSLLFGVQVVALRFFGWIPTTVLSTHAMQIGSAMEMILLSLALADRINSISRAKEASDRTALQAKQDLVDALRLNEVELEGHVARRTAELQQSQQQLLLKDKMAGLGTLTAGVAHEINNPTNFAHVSAQNLVVDIAEFQQFTRELVDADEAPEVLQAFMARFAKLTDHAKTMLNGTERIKAIVKDLRTFTRSDQTEKTTVRVSECLLSTLHLVRSSWQDKVEFVTEFIDDPLLACWPALLNQVFMNLLVNGAQAIAARPKLANTEPGRLTVTMQVKAGQLHIDFSDNGVGMSAEVQTRILEPFFTTKAVGEGTGLGLSISYGIILQHQGELQIDSAPGQGSCFSVLLPMPEKDSSPVLG